MKSTRLNYFKIKQTIIISAILGLFFTTTIVAQDIEISVDSTHQTIRGFGGAFIEFWQPDLTATHVQTAFGVGDGEIGLSILRLGINPDSTQWDESLEAAQKAQELGALIFASPWNAPANLLKEGVENDTVAVEHYADYAEHLNNYYKYMKRNGVDLFAISVQNEPDFAEDWTGWSTEGMVKFLRENAPDIETRVMAPESFQFRRDYTDPILNDSLATANTDIIGGHIYGGGNSRYELAEEKGKEVWMTEYLLNEHTGASSEDWTALPEEEVWDQTIQMAYTVHQSMKNNMQAYIWWYLKRYYSFLDDGTYRGINGEVTKRGYAFSHFSKYVRPGYKRIESAGPFGRGFLRVNISAYRDTLTDEVVIVAINQESGPKQVNFVINGMNSGTFSPIQSTIDDTIEPLDDIAVTGDSFPYELPGKSITTFISSGISVNNEIAESVPSNIKLNQNYPNPFNPTTEISFVLPESNEVSLKIYDLMGREIATLVDGRLNAGEHQYNFDATGLASGVYLYQITAGDFTQVKRMMLIK